MMYKGLHHGSKRRHRSSKTSASSNSLTSTEQAGLVLDPIAVSNDDPFDVGNRENKSASQPVTLERGHTDRPIKSRIKPDSPHSVGGGSLPRSPLFGGGKKDKGYSCNTANLLHIVANSTESIKCKLSCNFQ